MKYKIGDLIGKNELSFLSHMVMESLTKAAMGTLPENRNDDTEFDLTLTFNGVEIEIGKFLELLENSYYSVAKETAKPQAEELFEKFKQKYKSQNSVNNKLAKLKTQFDKANNILQNIERNLKEI